MATTAPARRPVKILWVTPFHPVDEQPDAASAVERMLLRHVAQHHTVHVISASLQRGEVSFPIGSAELTAEGVWWSGPPPEPALGTRALRALWPGPPADVRPWRDRARRLDEIVRWRTQRQAPDLVLVTAIELAPASGAVQVPMALMLPGSLTGRSRARMSGPTAGRLRRLRWQLDSRRATRWERHWAGKAVAIACTDPLEAELLGEIVGRDIKHISPEDPTVLLEWLDEIADSVAAQRSPATTSASLPYRAGSPESGPPSASVVLCTRERPDLLERSLANIAAATERAPGTELIIVEQGRPAARRVCALLRVEATVIHDEGVGAARARNIGARRATGAALLFTDDDCAVPSSWIADHLAALADPAVVASCGGVDGISRWTSRWGDAAARPARHHAGSAPWEIGHSSNMAVRREAFLRSNGFDERFGPGAPGGMICEDADLIVRLLRSKGSIASGVGSPVRHLHWRSPDEEQGNLRAYERGAGAWIGKLARRDRPVAMRYLRERLRLILELAREGEGLRPARAISSLGSFARGLAFGLRLSEWPAPADPGARTKLAGRDD